MKTIIETSHVINNDSIRNLINNEFSWLNEVPKGSANRLKVWLSRDSHFQSRGLPLFVTKALVKMGTNEVFIESKDSSLVNSIKATSRKLKNNLFEFRKKRRSS
jgi:ribosome-associated translation inhibitor RaiA